MRRRDKHGRSNINKYLMLEDVRTLSAKGANKSVFVIYQHPQRLKNRRVGDVQNRSNRLCETLKNWPSGCWLFDGEIAFLCHASDKELGKSLKASVKKYADKHGYCVGP
jgi:hypothetical protein